MPLPLGAWAGRAEMELLLCCARTELAPLVKEKLQDLLSHDIDWKAVTELAERHRMTPLVHKHVSSVAGNLLTHPDALPIAHRSRAIATRNLYLTRELLRILERLESEGVAAVPFKGPLLAISAFGNVSWREFDDLDILIKPRDIDKAKKVLTSMAYRPDREMTHAEETAFIRSEHAFHHFRDGDQVSVEIHWRLHDRYLSFPFDPTELWSGLSKAELFGKSVSCLNSEQLTLFLCSHGAKHYWERLEWICCLPAIIRSTPGIRWPVVIEQARKMRGLRMLELGLLLASDLDNTEATAGPLSLMMRNPIARELATAVWKNMDGVELAGSAREVYRFRFYLKARENLKDRLRVVTYATIRIPHPQSSVWERLRLPEWLWFLHYVLGPIRLFRKYGLDGLRGVFRPARVQQAVREGHGRP